MFENYSIITNYINGEVKRITFFWAVMPYGLAGEY
jgi:hypothetical protein